MTNPHSQPQPICPQHRAIRSIPAMITLVIIGTLLLFLAGWGGAFSPQVLAGSLYQAENEDTDESTTEANLDEENGVDDSGITEEEEFDPVSTSVPLILPLEIPEAETQSDTEAQPDAQFFEVLDLAGFLDNWEEGATYTASQLAARFENVMSVQSTGDFLFAYETAGERDTIRILPVAGSSGTEPLRLYLAWLMRDNASLPVPAGQLVRVDLDARLYSPPDGVTLSIRERGEAWQSSSLTMRDIQWETYTLLRPIDANANRVHIAITWEPELDNAWLQIDLPRIAIAAGEANEIEGIGAALSPTDTPTPEPTPTPSPEPQATPAPPAEDEAEDPAPTEEDIAEEIPIDTPTPHLIVVTSTPTPEDVFAAATQVARATEWAHVLGPATPTPETMVTATPTFTPIILTNTPTPENAATATYAARLATARAFTTGTPTPYPPDAVVLIATATSTPEPGAQQQARATNTPTPLFVYLDDIPPTPLPNATPDFPPELLGKILFLTDYLASNSSQPNVMIMNPDGSGLGLMTSRQFYNRANRRDAYSADQRFRAYVEREGVSANERLLQIKFEDSHYDSVANPLSFFGNGASWSPVWSPTQQAVAFVSNESGNDEIYLVRLNEWPAMQLTHNEWEWDHHPSFSPDGSQIVFSSNRNTGTRQIWMMDASGGNQRQMTNFPFEAWDPVWVKYPDS